VRRTTALLLAAALLAAASPASAAVINFDSLTLGDYDDIPTNHGSRGAGGEGDPNVAVSYSGANGTTTHLDFWNNNYGDLRKVAFSPSNGTNARIDLLADPGWLIKSLSFDIAGYREADRSIRTLIFGVGGVTASGSGDLIKGAGPSHSTYSIANKDDVRSAFIEWGTDWNIGIDNITFEVVRAQRPVPEPTSLALLMGAAGLAAIRRRRRA
jgi:hypothetical protein